MFLLALLPKQHISVGQSNETVILSYEPEVVALENLIMVPILYSMDNFLARHLN
jgi:hypothetical protein